MYIILKKKFFLVVKYFTKVLYICINSTKKTVIQVSDVANVLLVDISHKL